MSRKVCHYSLLASNEAVIHGKTAVDSQMSVVSHYGAYREVQRVLQSSGVSSVETQRQRQKEEGRLGFRKQVSAV